MKRSLAYLIVMTIGTLAVGTLLLLAGAFVLPAAVFDLPRPLLILGFYGGAYLLIKLFMDVSEENNLTQ